MFWDEELETVRLRKELLACQCDIRRALLVAEWQRLRSPGFWVDEAGKTAGRHPLGTLGLAATAGVLLIQGLRRPGSILKWAGRLGGMFSTALSLSGLFKRPDPQD